MLRRFRSLFLESYRTFIRINAGRRGAAIAFYGVTSIAPVLLIVLAISGLTFGQEAASGALYDQFRDLMGDQGANLVQQVIAGAVDKPTSILAAVISAVT